MMIKSILPFIAIGLFLLALLFRNKTFLKRKRLRKEPAEFGKIVGASGWVFIAGYCYFEASEYFNQNEYFDASLAFVFLAFSLLLAFLLVKTREKEDLFFTITKIALVAAIFYFPFSEISFLSDSLISITAKITSAMLNLINPGSVYMVSSCLFSWDNVPGNDDGKLIKFLRDDLDIGWAENAKILKSDDGKTIRIYKDEKSAEIIIDEKKKKAPLISDGRTHDLKVKKENGKLNIYDSSFIYSHPTSFDVQIILACTAIQSMVLFIGLIFGLNAPMRRKLKAFFVSVPVIYGLNIFRNVFVASAYFGQWFSSPRLQWLFGPPPIQSFDIAHGVLARIGSMIALIAIAYAVFVILPEALDLVEDFFRFIFKTIKRNN